MEMNHKLKIDTKTKIEPISSPRYVVQQSVALLKHSSINGTLLWKGFIKSKCWESTIWKVVDCLYTRSS